MSLLKKHKIDRLRKVASKSNVGREGLSKEAIKAIGECDGSYKSVMELVGKLVVIADASTFDDYWHEQVQKGISKMEFRFEQLEVNNDS